MPLNDPSSFGTMDEIHLFRALHLAERASALVSPNPTVGCVIAIGDSILGEGAHFYNNLDHAEVAALKQAERFGHNVHGATAYVTLEPCSHHGRTPPCANALIHAGITRCVIATVDPNPLVRGQGIAKLQKAGIAVALAAVDSLAAQQARTLNDAFAFSIQHGLPFVTLKAALSADGCLAPPSSARTAATPHWITGPMARADVQQLRHTSDAILTGIGTVLADNPSLTDRTGMPRSRPLLRVILDSDLRLPLTSVIATSAARDVLVFCHADAPAENEAALLAAGVQIIRLPGQSLSLNLPEVLKSLAARSIRSVLLEAGSSINASFLRESLVQKLVLYYAPKELGPGALPFATGIASPRDVEAQLTNISRASFPHNDSYSISDSDSEDLRLTGYLHNPWNGI